MNAVAAALAEGLDIECGVECASLWPLADSFDAVILTPPVPQSIAIAGRSFPELDRIRYDRCIALMVEGGWLDRPAAGVRQIPDGEPVAWIADEASRAGLAGGRSRAITIHSGAQFALDYWDQPPEAAAAILLPAAGIEPGAVWHYHRWKFAKPAVLHPERCFVQELARPAGGGIVSVFAGDAFGEPRVEGAVLSGWAAADALSRAF
jgi:predicted NAD/FAD-dependent oxidoreductase